ncbi:MAG: DUF2868 domain-containing protein [Burkholderiaceae bacterium]
MPEAHPAEPSASRSTRRWTVGDVIDFERYVHAEDHPTAAPAAEWLPSRSEDRRIVFLGWLDRVRAGSPVPSPGSVFERGRRLVQAFAIAVGLVFGAGLAGGLLSHHETEPINTLMFFGGTVGVQLVFLLLVGIAWLARIARLRISFVQDATLLLIGLAGRLTRRLDGDRRSALQSRWSELNLRSERLAPLVGCQVLMVTQLFAIAFNVGLLAAMLLVYLPFVELRFGWQSTYSFTTAGVDGWVRLVSTPWSWISAGLAPDASQVAATRYTRGQNAGSLPADAAHAWWPFLLCAIAFYGLALRVALAGLFGVVSRGRLARLSFTHPDATALWRRLHRPLVVTSGGERVLSADAGGDRPRPSGGTDLLIVDEDLASDEGLENVRRRFGGRVGCVVTANIDDDALSGVLTAALDRQVGSVAIATSATRDPIVAVAAFVRAVAGRSSKDVEITLLLCGDATDERMIIWRRFVGIQRLLAGVERCA